MEKGRKENLRSIGDRTTDEQQRITRMGGVASGEARRRKKTMKEALKMMLFDGKLSEGLKDRLRSEGVAEEDMNHQTAITRSLIAKAESGDVQAYNVICSMLGEKPADKMEVEGVPANLTIKLEGGENGVTFPSKESEIDMTKVDYDTGEAEDVE